MSCSGEKEADTTSLYDFPPLSQDQLTDLKERSEKIEGFFITTDLSDLDSTWAERGFYLYVCVRFLSDATLNSSLNKSAIPLLFQISNHKDRPEAEAVVLLHPKTQGVFYYKERRHFSLVDSVIMIRNSGYNIFDVKFNPKGKITQVSFIKNGISLEELEKTASERENESKTKKDHILAVTKFARQSSSSCENWPILNYTHSNELPDYLSPSENQVEEVTNN